MKKLVLTSSALVAFAVAAFAGPLNTKGVPVDAVGIVHLDFDAGAKSKVIQLVKEQMNKELAKDASAQKEFEAFKKDTGFDPQKDVNDVTIAFFSKAPGEEPDMVVVVRGKFSQKKINAAAQAKSAATVEGKNTLINMEAFMKAYGSAADNTPLLPSTSSDNVFGVVVNDKTIIIAEKEILPKALTAYNGKSYTAPAALVSFGKQVTNPVAVAFADGKAFPQEEGGPFPPAENAFLVIGESTKDVQLRLELNYPNESAPAQVNAMAQMFLGMAQASLANTAGPDGQPDPEKVKQAQQVTKLLSSLKLAPKGKAFTVAFDYSSEEAVNFIKEQATK